MTRREQFEQQLDADPAAWHIRLIYADWLESECGPPDYAMAECQRWMGTERKRPVKLETRPEFPKVWCWCDSDYFYPWKDGAVWCLHVDLFVAVVESKPSWRQLGDNRIACYETRRAAEAALCAALAKLRAQAKAAHP